MIADKIFPSFYMIEVVGQAVESIIPGDFGIERIAFSTNSYQTDLTAIEALQEAVNYIIDSPQINSDNIKEHISFNPEFYPSVGPIELTQQQIDDYELSVEAAEIESEKLEGTGQMAIPISRKFDALGDFISSRWIFESADFQIIAKTAMDPTKYIEEKTIEIMTQKSRPLFPDKNEVTFH